MKVGYISRRTDENGKDFFKYREGNATRRIGVRSDTVKVNFLYGTTPYDEIESNTKMMCGKLILVGEPFFTNDELKKKLEMWCEWANSCEHHEYSLLQDLFEKDGDANG